MVLYCGIYGIFCLSNNKIYIGSTKNMNKRFNDHRYILNINKHKNKHLQNAWNKYGKNNFKFKIIEKYDKYDENTILMSERKWINFYYPNIFNISLDPTQNPMLGRKHSEESKKKMGEINKGNHYALGKRHSLSKETRKRMSIAFKGRIFTEEHKRKISDGGKGKHLGPLAEEHKRKIGKANKGKPSWSKGKKLSKEYGEKISKIMKDRWKKIKQEQAIKQEQKVES